MSRNFITVLVLLYSASSTVSGGTVTIKTEQGEITGKQEAARNGAPFVSFYGVPFAKPPVGHLRFEAPTPAAAWEGNRDAQKYRNECVYGPPDGPAVMVGDEDCLFVNVFTRHPGDRDARRPVLIYIHGGAFIFGGAKVYNPRYIMEEDVVVVVLQYRLNIFGFLSLEDAAAPGNYGMLDQVEAMRWVQKYIIDYGGDPTTVTLFGMSAGGASVHYHMLSPLSRGLFHRAISQSGSSLNWWAHQRHPRVEAMKLANHTDCQRRTSKEVVDCLREISAAVLFASNRIFFDWHSITPEAEPMNVFSPRSDPESANPFMPRHPFVAMEAGDIAPVPYMLGYAAKEGIWRANYLLPDPSPDIWNDFVRNIDEVLPLELGIFGNRTGVASSLMEKIVEHYKIKDLGKLEGEKIDSFIDVCGDTMFNYGIDQTVKLHASKSAADTFFYYLTFPGLHSLSLFRTDHSVRKHPVAEMWAATHGTDMLLLWDMFPGDFPPMPDKDVSVSRKLISLVVDFAVNGNPSVAFGDWKSFDESDPSYLVMDEEFTVKKGEEMPNQERYKFWDSQDVFWNYALGRSLKPKEEL